MNYRWFISRTVRHATEMHRQVRKLINHQRDLLGQQAIDGITKSNNALEAALEAGVDAEALKKQMDDLEKAANKWLKPYPNAAIRENIEVFLVAIAVAVGIRTFFLQPFKIPTGSMQPTLYGVMPPPPYQGGPGNESDLVIPNHLERLWEFWTRGVSYFHQVAGVPGRIEEIRPPVKFLLFNLWQNYRIGDHWQKVWWPEDKLFQRAGLKDQYDHIQSPQFQTGDDVIRIKIYSGDHLFVDRFTYNFRRPERGEIIVFATAGTHIAEQDQFYIKRLIALGGENVSIGDDQHVVINGRRLDASTPHFANVYTFDPNKPGEGRYFGHVNGETGARVGRPGLAPLFPNAQTVYKVPDNAYLAMGDNTLNSYDSRGWGPVPEENVIGKSFFVYWPISKRFGWGY